MKETQVALRDVHVPCEHEKGLSAHPVGFHLLQRAIWLHWKWSADFDRWRDGLYPLDMMHAAPGGQSQHARLHERVVVPWTCAAALLHLEVLWLKGLCLAAKVPRTWMP
jgi:hypothetical protein